MVLSGGGQHATAHAQRGADYLHSLQPKQVDEERAAA
jgi:hypothetical protein